MKKTMQRLLMFLFCFVIVGTVMLDVLGINAMIVSEAHSGRTDSQGGHHDYKNKSGLGDYHYHCGGNPPHLHIDFSQLRM